MARNGGAWGKGMSFTESRVEVTDRFDLHAVTISSSTFCFPVSRLSHCLTTTTTCTKTKMPSPISLGDLDTLDLAHILDPNRPESLTSLRPYKMDTRRLGSPIFGVPGRLLVLAQVDSSFSPTNGVVSPLTSAVAVAIATCPSTSSTPSTSSITTSVHRPAPVGFSSWSRTTEP